MTLSEERCEFAFSSAKFLGHILSAEGITADSEKVKAIVCARAPGVVWACEHFKMNLLGSKFRLITDHKPLVHSYSNARSKPTPRPERWSLRLQPCDFQIVY